MSGRGGFAEEQAPLRRALDDDELFEMVNLATPRTGLSGIVHVSTRRASHGPRIKWFPTKPVEDAPCLVVTLETPPRAINHGLPPRVARQGEDAVVAWAERNRDALLRFWRDGVNWDSDEVQAFIDRLAKLP